MSEAKYVDGITCKARDGQYGEFFNISIKLDKLEEYKNDKGYINLTMSKRKEVGKYGETHSFKLNEWKPDSNQVQQGGDININDVPF